MFYSHTNKLVRFYEGVDGLKTGYTAEAGHCITTTANINGMRVIVVVMGEPDSKTRNAEVSSILDYVYAQFALKTIVSKDAPLGDYEVSKGKEKNVSIIPMKDATLFYKKSDGLKETNYEINVNKIEAPIKKGEKIGELIIKENGQSKETIDITVSKDIQKANLFELYLRYLKEMITFEF